MTSFLNEKNKIEPALPSMVARLLDTACYSVMAQQYEYVLRNPDGITTTDLNVDDLINLAIFLEELNAIGPRNTVPHTESK